jgi:hypothetical protein
MKKNFPGISLILFNLAVAVFLVIGVTNVSAQGNLVTAKGLITNPFGGTSIPFEITFSPHGGEVTGRILSYSSSVNVALPAGYQQTGGSTFPDCAINGSFGGGDGGELNLLTTCRGTLQTHVSGPGVEYNMTGFTDYTAQFIGVLIAAGTGAGDVAIALKSTIDQSTSPEVAYASEWTLQFSSEEFMAAFAPTITPIPPTALPLPVETEGAISGPLPAVEPTVNTPVTTPEIIKNLSAPAKTASSPLIPFGGALLGTSVGALLSLALQNKGKLIIGNINGGVPSPIDGRLVSPDEANWQNQQIARGGVWDGSRGGFFVPEKTQGESIISRLVREDREARALQPKPFQDVIDRLHNERVEGMQQIIDRRQENYQAYMKQVSFIERAKDAVSAVKAGADLGMEVMAWAIPGGKNIKSVYDHVTKTIEMVTLIQEEL